jgi:hypothetical protein
MKAKKQFSLFLITFSSIFITADAFSQSINFSGTWEIDKSRTNFNGAPEFVLPKALKVSQTSAGIVIDRTSINARQEEMSYTEQMTFEGKSSRTITASGNTEIDSLSSNSDRSSLVIGINAQSPDGNPILSALETWSLSDDAKTLIVDRQVQQATGMKFEIKGYFSKQ